MTIITDIFSIIASIATAVALFFLVYQISEQIKKDNTELIFNFYREFYRDKTYSEIFSILDFEHSKICYSEISLNEILETIISNEPFNDDHKPITIRKKIKELYEIDLPKEIELSNYMNFFNSIGKIIEDNPKIKLSFDKIFKYQIEKTLSHPVLVQYIINGKFNGFLALKKEIIIPFFFYGTLKDPEERKENIGSWEWERNVKCTLFGHKTIEISDEEGTYPALIKANDSSVKGVYSEVKVTNFFEFFKAIDNYEVVGELYERRLEWVQIDATSEKNLCWIYFKK
jgi:gamma-glutamylcyclotransferase (GGCT)/AIG2-like uncharacterized protein YtfP